MTKAEKTTSLYKLLAVLMQVPVDRKRGSGDREIFNFYLLFVGQVCRPVFAKAYDDVPRTSQRYKRRIRDSNVAIKDHGNKMNKNASKVDVVWLVKWFTRFAEEVGEVVQEMRVGVTAGKTEELGRHTESARLMRRKYKHDKISCSSDHAVIAMDYSQNLTIPSVANTPSQWYVCSLFSVSCFDIYYESDGVHTNYIYDKNASSKGSYQINSMLANFIEPKLVPSGRTKLTGYADNCSGPEVVLFCKMMIN
ncbi:hypothetical protein PR003_g17431 [Phytophthora rubi]|uniref:Uncharacterized protein n=1 Tax=Phytophthora rubi TaxID=129364 RepID=A0A6A4ECA0_9STRA|nr:hypothetical protein PR003_g17431 [Phytophthora rubi]